VTATTVPSGLTVVITYNGSGLYPIAVGSYTGIGHRHLGDFAGTYAHSDTHFPSHAHPDANPGTALCDRFGDVSNPRREPAHKLDHHHYGLGEH
jgi:hypothetical protein